MVILVDRFFVVVKLMKKIMIRKKVFFFILGIWLFLVVVFFGFILGWGCNDYNVLIL